MKRQVLALVLASVSLMSGCFRGQRSEKPPVRLFKDMQDQPRYDPYGKSPFHKDGATMQQPIEGTVSDEGLLDESRPALSAELLERGQNRYDTFCSPCHGAIGDGKGMVAVRGIPKGLVPPTNYHSDAVRAMTDDHFYDVVTNGVRNMSGYASKLSVKDRWAIVNYMRVLQRSQYAALSDVPEEKRQALLKGSK